MNLPILSGRFGSALSVLACAPVFAQTVEFDTRCIQGGNFTGAELGDIDGDGDLDVVAYDVSGGNVVWLENNLASTGNWAAGATVGSLASTTQIQIVDANGDGHLDIMAFSASGQQLEYYRSLGTAPPTFAAAVVLASTSAPTSLVSAGGFVAADFDGQGDDIDIVIADDAQTLLLQDLGSSLSEISGYPTVALGMQKVAAGDFDGNGALDVALSSTFSGGSLIAIMNSGGASFGNAFRVKSGFPGANHLAVANIDGLHGDDVILGSDYRVDLFLSDGAGLQTYTRGSITTLFGSPLPRLGDLDGENGPDLVVVQAGGTQTPIQLALNDGTDNPFGPNSGVMTLVSPPSPVSAYLGYTGFAVGDLDGDSFGDILTRSGAGAVWYENKSIPALRAQR
jgi:hypothetical protein